MNIALVGQGRHIKKAANSFTPTLFWNRHGGVEAGMFCGLSTLSEQKENDNSVDVYMLAKLYHLKRPGIYSKEVRMLLKT